MNRPRVEQLKARAVDCFKKEDYEEALTLFADAFEACNITHLDRLPQGVSPEQYAAMLQAQPGLPQRARELAKKGPKPAVDLFLAYTIVANMTQCYINLGRFHLALDQMVQAVELEGAIDKLPAAIRVIQKMYARKVVACHGLKRFDEAIHQLVCEPTLQKDEPSVKLVRDSWAKFQPHTCMLGKAVAIRSYSDRETGAHEFPPLQGAPRYFNLFVHLEGHPQDPFLIISCGISAEVATTPKLSLIFPLTDPQRPAEIVGSIAAHRASGVAGSYSDMPNAVFMKEFNCVLLAAAGRVWCIDCATWEATKMVTNFTGECYLVRNSNNSFSSVESSSQQSSAVVFACSFEHEIPQVYELKKNCDPRSSKASDWMAVSKRPKRASNALNDIPPPRSDPTWFVSRDNETMYMYGGHNDGAYKDDMWRTTLGSNKWKQVTAFKSVFVPLPRSEMRPIPFQFTLLSSTHDGQKEEEEAGGENFLFLSGFGGSGVGYCRCGLLFNLKTELFTVLHFKGLEAYAHMSVVAVRSANNNSTTAGGESSATKQPPPMPRFVTGFGYARSVTNTKISELVIDKDCLVATSVSGAAPSGGDDGKKKTRKLISSAEFVANGMAESHNTSLRAIFPSESNPSGKASSAASKQNAPPPPAEEKNKSFDPKKDHEPLNEYWQVELEAVKDKDGKANVKVDVCHSHLDTSLPTVYPEADGSPVSVCVVNQLNLKNNCHKGDLANIHEDDKELFAFLPPHFFTPAADYVLKAAPSGRKMFWGGAVTYHHIYRQRKREVHSVKCDLYPGDTGLPEERWLEALSKRLVPAPGTFPNVPKERGYVLTVKLVKIKPCKGGYWPHNVVFDLVDINTTTPVSRQFVCSSHLSLGAFAERILTPVMGWEADKHMHIFTLLHTGAVFGMTRKNDFVDAMHKHVSGTFWLNEDHYTLAELMQDKKGRELHWTHDLGDRFEHLITLDRITDDDEEWTTTVLSGENRCPPEDSSGQFVHMMESGDYSNIREYVESADIPYDPTIFSLQERNGALQKALVRKGYAGAGASQRVFPMRRGRENIDGSTISSVKDEIDESHDVFSTEDAEVLGLKGKELGAHADGSVEIKGISKDGLKAKGAREEADKHNVCAACAKPANSAAENGSGLVRCGACGAAHYCSVVCALADKKRHKSDEKCGGCDWATIFRKRAQRQEAVLSAALADEQHNNQQQQQQHRDPTVGVAVSSPPSSSSPVKKQREEQRQQQAGKIEEDGEAAVVGKEEEEGNKKECVICLDNDKSFVAIPCGHLALCEACANPPDPQPQHSKKKQKKSEVRQRAITTCPVCRREVERWMKVFH